MSNLSGNPNIAEHGKATQFGTSGGPDPSIVAKERNPSSIRAALRRIAAMDVRDAKKMAQDIDKLSMANAIALTKFQRALKGDIRAMQQLEDSIDGKLTEKVEKRQVTLAELVQASFDGER